MSKSAAAVGANRARLRCFPPCTYRHGLGDDTYCIRMCRISHLADNRCVLISKYAVGVRRDDTGGGGRLLREQAGMRRLAMTVSAQLARGGVQVALPNAATPVRVVT